MLGWCRLLDHSFDKEPVCPLCRQGAPNCTANLLLHAHALGAGLSELLMWCNNSARKRAKLSGDQYSHGSRQIVECKELTSIFTRHTHSTSRQYSLVHSLNLTSIFTSTRLPCLQSQHSAGTLQLSTRIGQPRAPPRSSRKQEDGCRYSSVT